MVQFGYTIFYVEDVTRTIEFYEKAFGFERKFISPENDYGELVSGATTLSFASISLGKSNFKNGFLESSLTQVPFGIEIALTTANPKDVVENALKHGAVLVENPIEKPWGQIVAYIRDINGFLIEICTPMAP